MHARRVISILCNGGAMSGLVLCGGMNEGMKNIRDRPCEQATSSAKRRCPKWGGLNVPPRIPMLRELLFSKKGLVFTIEDLILNQNDLKKELS